MASFASPEMKAMSIHANELTKSLSTKPLFLRVTNALVEKKFIKDKILLQMLNDDHTPSGRATILIKAVEKVIEAAPEKFMEFLEILSKQSWTKEIAENLLSTYQKSSASPQQVLTEKDVVALLNLMHTFSNKWSEIGLELGFTPSELQQISHRPSLIMSAPVSFLTTLLSQWVQWPTKEHPTPPTLQALCDALRSSLVALGSLAEKVQREMATGNSECMEVLPESKFLKREFLPMLENTEKCHSISAECFTSKGNSECMEVLPESKFLKREFLPMFENTEKCHSISAECFTSKAMSFSGSNQLISPQKWINWYVYMQDNAPGNVRGWNGYPGQQGHWKITKIGSSNNYLLSTQQWPDWYMFMEDNEPGNVRGMQGDPGPQGHWIITQRGTVIINGENVPTYVLSTEWWPNWFIYMQNNGEGNVRGWDGDPGIQGYFIFQKAPSKGMTN